MTSSSFIGCPALAAQPDDDCSAEAPHGEQPAGTQRGPHRSAIPADSGVVVVAQQPQAIDRRADPIAGGFDQSVLELALGKVDARNIARDPAGGRYQQDARRMRILSA